VPVTEASKLKHAGTVHFVVALAVSGIVVWAIFSGELVHFFQPPQVVVPATTQNW